MKGEGILIEKNKIKANGWNGLFVYVLLGLSLNFA